MARLGADYAWSLIRDAPGLDWQHPRSWRDHATGVEIRVRPGGEWSASHGVSERAAFLLNTLLPIACMSTPFAIGQLGQSLDGRIATENGHSHYVTGHPSRVHLHRLRALVDAVVVGAGTVAADNPQLTVRHVSGENPARVVIDPRGRLDASARVFTDNAAPTLRITANSRRSMAAAHVSDCVVDAPNETIDATTIKRILAEHGLHRLLIEGGADTLSRFLAADALDRLHVVIAPLIIGSGRPGVRLSPVESLYDVRRPPCRTHAMHPDTLFDLDLSAGLHQ